MRLELYRKYDVSSFPQELRPPPCTSQLSFRQCLYIQNRFRQLVTLFPWGSPVLCQLPSDAHGATVCSSSPPWSSCDPSQPKGMLLYISWGDNLRSIRENKAPHADAISMSLLLTTVTHRRSFHMKSNYPFPHSVKQHCMLGVRFLLALVWAYCVEHACFSLGTGCPQQPVWCSSARKVLLSGAHPEEARSLSLLSHCSCLLGSWVWSMPVSLSTGKYTPEFSVGNVWSVSLSPAGLCYNLMQCNHNPCNEHFLHHQSCWFAQKVFNLNGWYTLSCWVVCRHSAYVFI